MPEANRANRSDRPRLDRRSVVAEAIAVADEHGPEAISMRALAARLGVVPMALYKHVADKEDLLGGMIDAIVDGYAAPPAGGSWTERIRWRLQESRAAVLAHPWLRPAIEARRSPTPSVLAHMDAVSGELLSGGISVDLAHYAMHALGSRIWGFSPEAFPGPAVPEPAVTGADAAAAAAAMAGRFPHVVAIAADAASRNPSGACDAEFEFAFTNDLLLEAIGRLHEAGWVSRSPRDSAAQPPMRSAPSGSGDPAGRRTVT